MFSRLSAGTWPRAGSQALVCAQSSILRASVFTWVGDVGWDRVARRFARAEDKLALASARFLFWFICACLWFWASVLPLTLSLFTAGALPRLTLLGM